MLGFYNNLLIWVYVSFFKAKKEEKLLAGRVYGGGVFSGHASIVETRGLV